MSLSRTETDEVTGASVYYINEGLRGGYFAVPLSGKAKKDNKKIAKRMKMYGGDGDIYFTNKTKKAFLIFTDDDAAVIPNFELGRDAMVFSEATFAKLQFREGLNGIGTLLFTPNDALVDNAVAYLPGVSRSSFEAHLSAGGYGFFYE
jgi:hypothetical protein